MRLNATGFNKTGRFSLNNFPTFSAETQIPFVCQKNQRRTLQRAFGQVRTELAEGASVRHIALATQRAGGAAGGRRRRTNLCRICTLDVRIQRLRRFTPTASYCDSG